MSATEDMRVMAAKIVRFVAERGDTWEQPGTPEYLLVEAARLITGVANGMERAGIDLSTESEP